MSSSEAPAKIAPDVTLTYSDEYYQVHINVRGLCVQFYNLRHLDRGNYHYIIISRLLSIGLLFCVYESIPDLPL